MRLKKTEVKANGWKRDKKETETRNDALLPYRMYWERKKYQSIVYRYFRVVDPQWFPCGFWSSIIDRSMRNWIRIQGCEDQKLQIFIPRTLKRTSKPQAKPSALKRECPALQTKKFLHIAFAYFRVSGGEHNPRYIVPVYTPDVFYTVSK